MAPKKNGKNGTSEFVPKRILAVQTKQLPCTLTEIETRDAGKKLAHLEGLLAQHTAEEKDVKDALKAKRSSIEGQIHALAGMIRQGYEYRPVDVKIEADFHASKVFEIRQDTGEVVAERAMQDHERQRSLLDDAPVRDEKPAPAPLSWVPGDSKDVEVAKSAGGEYRIVFNNGLYIADYKPSQGPGKSLAFQVPTRDEARKACEQHHVTEAASAMLKQDGHPELAKADVVGEASAFKKTRAR